MNGRVYDPLIGKFLSGDPFVQDPTNGQNYNRYSYVLNNPTNLTDPTGYCSKGNTEVTGSSICQNIDDAAKTAERLGTQGTSLERTTTTDNTGKVVERGVLQTSSGTYQASAKNPGAAQGTNSGAANTGDNSPSSSGAPVLGQVDDPQQQRNSGLGKDHRSDGNGSVKRPELVALAKTPTVAAAIDEAWKNSKPDGPGNEKREVAFWVVVDTNGKVQVQYWKTEATQSSIKRELAPNGAVAWFHSHPNTREENYRPWPSNGDLWTSYYSKLPGIIQSHEGMYYFGPPLVMPTLKEKHE